MSISFLFIQDKVDKYLKDNGFEYDFETIESFIEYCNGHINEKIFLSIVNISIDTFDTCLFDTKVLIYDDLIMTDEYLLFKSIENKFGLCYLFFKCKNNIFINKISYNNTYTLQLDKEIYDKNKISDKHDFRLYFNNNVRKRIFITQNKAEEYLRLIVQFVSQNNTVERMA